MKRMSAQTLTLLAPSTGLIAGATLSFVPPRNLPYPHLFTASNYNEMGAHKIIHPAHIGDIYDDTSEMILCSDETDVFRQRNKRRSFISLFAASAVMSLSASPALAVKGAAEYDLEYYMRDLFMGNKPEGNLPASNAPSPHPPRNLQGPLVALLLDDELQSCIPIQELNKATNIPISTLSEQIRTFRSKVGTAFRSTHPWKEELVNDEYYFDLTCYALWRTASVAMPQDYAKRDEFIRHIGRRLLKEIMNQEMLSKKVTEILYSSSQKVLSLTETVPCVIEILNLFQSTNYCTNYRLGDKNDAERTGLNVFDQLDNDEISSSSGGGSVNCLVSIFDPAELGGSLQITGEGSRFAPDYVGPTLAAVWERVGGEGIVSVSFESYFVDPIYRPNPKDFFPNERFYQFTISRK